MEDLTTEELNTIQDCICSQMADEEWHYAQQESYEFAMQEEIAWYNHARLMGWE